MLVFHNDQKLNLYVDQKKKEKKLNLYKTLFASPY